MLLSIGGLTILLLIVMQTLSLYGTRELSRASLKATSLLLARYQAEKVRASLAYAETSSEAILRTIEVSKLLDDKERLDAYLRAIMEGNPQISAIEVHAPERAPIVLNKNQDGSMIAGEATYNEEFVARRSLQEQVEGVWVVSSKLREIARAYHFQSRNGVRLFIEIPFHHLAAPIEKTEGAAYGFLATDRKLYFDSRLVELEGSPEWIEFSSQILLGPVDGEGFSVRSDPLNNQPAWVGIARVGDLPLKAGVVYRESDQFDLVSELVWWTLGLSAGGVVLILVVTNFLTIGMVTPLEQLCAKVDAAAESGFEGRIDTSPQASSEVVGLAGSFNRLMDDIRAHLNELESAVAKRQALESELAIASRIQESIMPDLPFESTVATADGISTPAREVGGDFLGVFPIDSKRVGFLIGDVSGKGIPAAIYMAFTASLIEHLGRLDVCPKESFEIINQALCARQEPSMFATVFFGILHESGLVEYCNAGHHPPLIIKPEGGYREIEVASGLAIGIFDSFEFGQSTFQLEEDEVLFLFTDGLTEAMNAKHEEFGEERVKEFLDHISPKHSLTDLVKDLTTAVMEFRGAGIPNDDLTMLFVKPHFGRDLVDE